MINYLKRTEFEVVFSNVLATQSILQKTLIINQREGGF